MPSRGALVALVLVCAAATAVTAAGAGSADRSPTAAAPVPVRTTASPLASAPEPRPVAIPAPAPPAVLPDGGRKVFPGNILVAYYGTAGSGALGVLGEAPPDKITRRLREAARPFGREGLRVQIVYELIVTIADAHPGKDGDYSHDIRRSDVRRYIDAAHRNNALLVLDLQPGRSDFLTVAKRWAWALRDPWVGLALDPEWRMGPHQVPARVIGHVGAREVNRVSAWLQRLTTAGDLPQKVFMLHQFRTDMIRHIERVRSRADLATVQHVDGFGTRRAKLNTFHTVARPQQFRMGFKLFYDEDIHLFRPREVLAIRPRIRFVSYQ